MEYKKKIFSFLVDKPYMIEKQNQHIDELTNEIAFLAKQFNRSTGSLPENQARFSYQPKNRDVIKYVDQISLGVTKIHPQALHRIEDLLDQRDAARKVLSRLEKLPDMSDIEKTLPSARNPLGDTVTRNTIRLADKIRLEFLYDNETDEHGHPVPVADGYVLFWRYKVSQGNPNDKRIDIRPGKGGFARTIGILRTDKEGKTMFACPQMDGKGLDIVKAQYCLETDNETKKETCAFRIVSDTNLRKEAQKRLNNNLDEFKKGTPDSFLNQHALEISASYPEAYHDAVQKDQNDNRQWSDIPELTSAYLETGTYGFMILPPDMGDCEIQNLERLPEQKVTIHDQEIHYAVTKTFSEFDDSPIRLPCTFRDYTRRLNLKRKELEVEQQTFNEVNLQHYKSLYDLTTRKSFLQIVAQHRFHHDGFGIDRIRSKNDPTIKGRPEFEIVQNALAMYNQNEKRKMNLYLDRTLKDNWDKACEYYMQSSRKSDLILAFDELIQNISDYIPNGETYFIEDVPEKLLDKKEEERVHEALRHINQLVNAKLKGDEGPDAPETLEASIAVNNYQYELARDQMKKTARELWNMIRSKPFRAHFKAYMDLVKGQEIPPDKTAGHDEYLDELKNQFEAVFATENVEDMGQIPTPDFKQAVLFPPSFANMSKDYYSGFIFDVLNHTILMLSDILGEEVFEKEIQPGLETLARREELIQFSSELRKFLPEFADKIEKGKVNHSETYSNDKIADKLETIFDTIKEIEADPPSKKLPDSVMTIWAKAWDTFKTHKDLLASTIIPAPGPDNLLQASLNIFERYAINRIVANPKKTSMYVNIMVAVISVCRFQIFSSSRQQFRLLVCQSLVDRFSFVNAKTKLKFILEPAAFGDALPISRPQLLAISAVKTGMLVLSFYSLIEEWSKFIEKDSDSIDEYVRTAFDFLHLFAKSIWIPTGTLLLTQNLLKIVGKELMDSKKLGKFANRLAGILQVMATIDSGFKLYETISRDSKSREIALNSLELLGNIMVTAGFMVSSTWFAGFASLTFLTGLGPVLFVGGIVLLLVISNHDNINDALRSLSFFLQNTTSKNFIKFVETFETNNRIYFDDSLGAKEKTIQSLDNIKNNIRFFWYDKETQSGDEPAYLPLLSWRAIIPLRKLGITKEEIAPLIFVENEKNDDDPWWERVLDAINPLSGIDNYLWGRHFKMEKNITDLIFRFYDRVSNPDNARATLGSQTCAQIARDLEHGIYQPLTFDQVYMELKNEASYPFPPEFSFLKHPFYSVLPQPWGLSYRYMSVCHIHDYNLRQKEINSDTFLSYGTHCDWETKTDESEWDDDRDRSELFHYIQNHSNLSNDIINDINKLLGLP